MSYLYLKMLNNKSFLELLNSYIKSLEEEEDYFTDSDSDYEPDTDTD
tara:strand:- start:561 stop:701 length:141 start_codon:yes stop_codon:yes gene_type:complete